VVNRSDVYLADLTPRSGSEQTGRRPVVVISNNGFNQTLNWKSLIVIPVSSSGSQAQRGLTAVLLPKGSGGLTKDSVALCHQITTVDRSKLLQFFGHLSDKIIKELEEGIKAAIDIE